MKDKIYDDDVPSSEKDGVEQTQPTDEEMETVGMTTIVKVPESEPEDPLPPALHYEPATQTV